MGKAGETVSIRIPKGVADELRAVSGVSLSTLARHMLIQFLNTKKAQMAKAGEPLPPKESNPDD